MTIPLFRPQSDTVGMIVGHIKSACTKRIRALGHIDFAWQALFHDRIIRDAREWERIAAYIHNNPRCWNERHTVNRFSALSRDPRIRADARR